jgi:gamma-glutamylcyclotransferase (GGCT)/AIG2-like uncharacterized protein YtfP
MSTKSFFVYGTLRPDINVDWTELVHKNPNFKLTYSKASLKHSKLYFHKELGYPMCIYDPKEYTEHDVTMGFILETDNLESTLKVLDEIEGYPFEYDRVVIECFNEDLEVPCSVFFYTQESSKIDRTHLHEIGVNDWALYL